LSTAWISPARHPNEDVGVFVFRCPLTLAEVPEVLLCDISADQRYRLTVNDQFVDFGPARGDLAHWHYETLDLALYLRVGENEIRATVWNFGWLAPMAQISLRTGFVCRSEHPALNTPGDWQVASHPAWSFQRQTASTNDFYMEVGPGENFDARVAEGDWRTPAVIVEWRDAGSRYESHWAMTPRPIPPMRYERRDRPPVVRLGSLDDLTTPVILDYQELLCAFPRFTFSGPAGTSVTLTYDEGLWEKELQPGIYGQQPAKGHRDEIANKEPRGYQDKVTLGAEPVTFEPFWWRTFRYITVSADGPANLTDLTTIETGYPYEVESSFIADDPRVAPIWTTAIRTAQRCAGETYFDCPYYEQLQYAGDTRIQVLIHYYLSRDRRLPRHAIAQLGSSIDATGLTQSRYPNRTAQYIPPFSLWWIMMLHDQLLYDGDASPNHPSLTTAATILRAFDDLRASGDRYWMFADWVPEWDAGVPPGGIHSDIHTLTYALAETALAQLEDRVLPPASSVTPDTEHAAALWRLLQAMRGEAPDRWPTANLTPTTLYFAYYKHLAKQPEDYLTELKPWTQMIEAGLTTFAETPEPARSDCHAWSAHPILGFLQIVAGVTSIAPGWRAARIAPHPGSLRRFDARIAHPAGDLSVAWDGAQFEVNSPVPFDFHYRDQTQRLSPGRHQL